MSAHTWNSESPQNYRQKAPSQHQGRCPCAAKIFFCLNTPIEWYEYIRLPINIITEEIMDQYGLRAMEKYGYVYVKNRKGMYGIPQALRIANNFTTKNISSHGHFQYRLTPVPWKHKWRPSTLYLVVDYFGVKHARQKHAAHIITCIIKYYLVSVD